MSTLYRLAVLALGLAAAPAIAQEPNTPLPPPVLLSLAGCWSGTGTVQDKPVTIRIAAKPILGETMMLAEVDSADPADADDRYCAHLLFGGGEGGEGAVTGFWADSFGGAFTATGKGQASETGFTIDYAYPDSVFANRWTVTPQQLAWEIVAKTKEGETPFASYRLARAACDTP